LVSEDRYHLLLDFQFNGWGKKFPSELDNAISRKLFANGLLEGKMEDHEDFVLEGGSIESDGRGTIFTTSQCLLAPNRNQPLTQNEIEGKLKQYLHAERIVWLDHGNLTGDDTDGHIDTIVRTAPDDTLLYVGCDDPNDEQYEDFRSLEKQLQGLRTIEDKPYRLMRLPMPDAISDDGDRLPATYANFVIINGAVICPTYRQPTKDAAAMSIIGEAFPDREVIGIDACTVIRQHGSLHCLTMQYPL
jgi:agmatine/peptidylarginine deiminase